MRFFDSYHVWASADTRIVGGVGVNDIKIPDNRFSLKSFD